MVIVLTVMTCVSSVSLALGVTASGSTRAILRALDVKVRTLLKVVICQPIKNSPVVICQCYRSNRRLTRYVAATVSLAIGFILMALCAEPEVRLTAAMLQHRFSSLSVLNLMLTSLLVMLGVLSWVADIKSRSRADSVQGAPQHAFATIAGLAGSYKLVFQKVRNVWHSVGFDIDPNGLW